MSFHFLFSPVIAALPNADRLKMSPLQEPESSILALVVVITILLSLLNYLMDPKHMFSLEDASLNTRSVESGSHGKRRNSTHITPIDEAVRSYCCRLRWFGHVQRRGANCVTSRVVYGLPGNSRYQTTKTPHQHMWHQHMNEGMTSVGVTQDRPLWLQTRRSGGIMDKADH